MLKVNINQTNPHTFGVYLESGYFYFRLYWIEQKDAGWFMDILDVDLNSLVCGIPLICNTNLTKQYRYKVPFDVYVYSESYINTGRYELETMEFLIDE